MIQEILRIILSFLGYFVADIFGPLFAILNGFLANLHLEEYIVMFNNTLDSYFTPFILFFLELLPPMTFRVLLLEITTQIIFFGFALTIHAALKVLKLIKKMPLA